MTLAVSMNDVWVSLLTNTPPSVVFALLIWYFLSKTLPAMEATHERQVLVQRADLLELVRKEKELSEKVIQIFASAQQITVKDNHDAIQDLSGKADVLRQAAAEILEAFKSSTVVSDEIVRVRMRLSEFERKYGSDPTRRGSRRTRTNDDDDTPEPGAKK